jgi:hypothetical protein
MIKKIGICFVTCVLICGVALTASAQLQGNPVIRQFLEDYHAALVEARADDEGVAWVRDFYAVDAIMYVRSFWEYDAEYSCSGDGGMDDCRYIEQPPWNCDLTSVNCGCTGEIIDGECQGEDQVSESLFKFMFAYPGMEHNNKNNIYYPVGEGVWKIHNRYDWMIRCRDDSGEPTGRYWLNMPGISVFTVDLKQRRKDGGKGRIIEGDLLGETGQLQKQFVANCKEESTFPICECK